MADTTFVPRKTNIVSTWLNDVNAAVYRAASYVLTFPLRMQLSKNSDVLSVMDAGAVGDGVTDDTAAITLANSVAASMGRSVYFPAPPVAYIYNPSAPLNITTRWYGESKYNTIINVSNSYAGEVFRLLPSAVLSLMTIQKPGLTKTAGSIGVRVSALNTKDQCVNCQIDQVFIRGFEKNLDHQNTYVFHAYDLHIESGTEGIYCVPDASGGLGFVTTHTYVNCDIGNNVRDIFYNSPNYSNTFTFIGGNISGATGASAQASFNKMRDIKFVNTYFEAAATIPALQLQDVDYVDIDGAYINNTGGITVASGSPIRLSLRNIWCTQATDTLKGADGFQYLSAHSCSFPSSGNAAVANWKTLVLENTDYNNVRYTYMAKNHACGFFDISQAGGGTVVVDMNKGNYQRITVTDTTNFNVGVPTNIVAGTLLWLTIQNSGGGAPAITWNAAFKMTGAGTPATGNNRTWTFVYNGSNFYQVGPAPTDIPN